MQLYGDRCELDGRELDLKKVMIRTFVGRAVVSGVYEWLCDRIRFLLPAAQ